MEATLNDTDAINAIHSPPKRRRSTFFEKRDSLDPQPSENTNWDEDQLIAHLENYQQGLKKERELWKTEARERRFKYKDLKAQLAVAASASIDYSLLTEEDIVFLKGKPKIKKIASDCQSFHSSVCDTMMRIQRWRELQNAVLVACEQKVDRIHEYILENSSLGIGEDIAEVTAITSNKVEKSEKQNRFSGSGDTAVAKSSYDSERVEKLNIPTDDVPERKQIKQTKNKRLINEKEIEKSSQNFTDKGIQCSSKKCTISNEKEVQIDSLERPYINGNSVNSLKELDQNQSSSFRSIAEQSDNNDLSR